MIRASSAVASGCALILVLLGCTPNVIRQYRAHYPNSQSDAGSVTVAVVAVERWQDVVAGLRPAFDLTGDKALEKVLPITSLLQDKLLDSFGASVSVALPTATVTRTENVAKSDGQARTTDSKTIERKETSGQPPAAPTLTDEARDASKLPGLDTLAELIKDNIKSNPQLQYQTALALFQEVKLLNRYVDAATGRHGFEPYLVRLQIGVTPYAHRQPYDVYTRIGFFNGVSAEKACGEVATKSTLPDDPQQRCLKLMARVPEVVPLVVTDDLEVTRQSRATEVVRQLEATLSGTVQGVGVAGQLQALNDQLQSLVGSSLNSLSSVTRLSDNTLQARLGAVNDPSIGGCYRFWYSTTGCKGEDRSMVNRNYFVSALVLVPQPLVSQSFPDALRVMTKTDMRSIGDGSRFAPQLALVEPKFRETLSPYNEFIERDSHDPDWDFKTIVQLMGAISSNNHACFYRMLNDEATECSDQDKSQSQESKGTFNQMVGAALWTDLAGLTASFDLHMATIDLPYYGEVSLPPEQIAFLRDDRATGIATIRLQDGAELGPEWLVGRLNVRTISPLARIPAPNNTYPVPADSIVADQNGRSVTLSFPSLQKLGVLPGNIDKIELVLSRRSDSRYETFARLSKPETVVGGSHRRSRRADILGAGLDFTEDARQQDRCKSQVNQVRHLREKIIDIDCRPFKQEDYYKCDPGTSTCYYLSAYAPVNPASADATFMLRPVVERILLTDAATAKGEVKLIVGFEKLDGAPDEIKLAIANAELVDVSAGATKDVESNTITIKGGAGDVRRLTVSLGSLAVEAEVTITATGTRNNVAVTGPATPLKLVVKAPGGGLPVAAPAPKS